MWRIENFSPSLCGRPCSFLQRRSQISFYAHGKSQSFWGLLWIESQLHQIKFVCCRYQQFDMEAIKDITKFSQGSFPFRYLGIPVADSKLTISQYSPLIDKITNYISAWVGASLSYAGRTKLVKLVLQGVECFCLSILPIPVRVKTKIV